MLLFALFFSFLGVLISEEDTGSLDHLTCVRVIQDLSFKIGKAWMHYMLLISLRCKHKIVLFSEIFIHYALFVICRVFSEELQIYGQLGILEVASILLYSFLDVLQYSSPSFFEQLIRLIIFYVINIVFFLNFIPNDIVAFVIFGAAHVFIIIIFFRKSLVSKQSYSSSSFSYEEIINIGMFEGYNSVIVQRSNPNRIELIQLIANGSHRIKSKLILERQDSILRQFHSQSQMVHVQCNNMLYLYKLPSFKLLKLYDMGNDQVLTDLSIRHIHEHTANQGILNPCHTKAELSPKKENNHNQIAKEPIVNLHQNNNNTTKPDEGQMHSTSPFTEAVAQHSANDHIQINQHPFSLMPNKDHLDTCQQQNSIFRTEGNQLNKRSLLQEEIDFKELPSKNNLVQVIKSNKKNNTYYMLEDPVDDHTVGSNHHQNANDQNNLLSQPQSSDTIKLYIPHENQPLIAEIQTSGNESQIRIINYLCNFEERKLLITIPIRKQKQLLQFIRIDGSDKIFFISEANSYCLIDINKNISEIVRSKAQRNIQCAIVNERDLILSESNYLYFYDLPASLFIKKIKSYHINSHLLPICNAPGFYLVIPSTDHSHRILPQIVELVNESLIPLQLVGNKYCCGAEIELVLYDTQHGQLFLFTKQSIFTQKNIILKNANQPLTPDHIILNVSIYQQQCKEFI